MTISSQRDLGCIRSDLDLPDAFQHNATRNFNAINTATAELIVIVFYLFSRMHINKTNMTHLKFFFKSHRCTSTNDISDILQAITMRALVSFASLLAISGTFNSLFKVLFTFPSRYLFAIGLELMFSLGRKLPPSLRSTSKERDSQNTNYATLSYGATGFSPSVILRSKKNYTTRKLSYASIYYNSAQMRKLTF